MKPGDYVLGSEKSRAAARQLLEEKRTDADYLTIISSVPRPDYSGADDSGPWCTPWRECADGSFLRMCYFPQGMSTEEGFRTMVVREDPME